MSQSIWHVLHGSHLCYFVDNFRVEKWLCAILFGIFLKVLKVTIADPSLIHCFTRKITMFHVDFLPFVWSLVTPSPSRLRLAIRLIHSSDQLRSCGLSLSALWSKASIITWLLGQAALISLKLNPPVFIQQLTQASGADLLRTSVCLG